MNIHRLENTVYAGQPLDQAQKVIILVHGRGANAGSILPLADALALDDFALVAPNATGNTWYPFSFMAPKANNEPHLQSAIDLLSQLVAQLEARGFSSRQIYFAGFSQGACLTAEFVARHAKPYGGVMLFTGGLIGAVLERAIYHGNFEQTPIFLGTGDPDPHVPVERVQASTQVFQELGARVEQRIYPGIPHTITAEEIAAARSFLGL